MLLVKLRSAVVAFGEATLRTCPSSGQATKSSPLRLPRLLACHSGAALAGAKVDKSPRKVDNRSRVG